MMVNDKTRAIRAATPKCLAELYAEQGSMCDLCGYPIQDEILAELDHSTPVIWFAESDLSVEEAVQLANSRSNLKAVHKSCNSAKGKHTREEWFQLGLNHRDEPRQYLGEEIEALRARLSQAGYAAGKIGGHITGLANKELKRGWFAPGTSLKSALTMKKLGSGIFSPGTATAMGRLGGKIGGSKGGPASAKIQQEHGTGIFSFGIASKAGKISNHLRWHTRRNSINSSCEFCAAGAL